MLGGEALCHSPLAEDFWRDAAIKDFPEFKREQVIVDLNSPLPPAAFTADPVVLTDPNGELTPSLYSDWRRRARKPDGIPSVFAYLLDAIGEADPLWTFVDREKIVDLSKAVTAGVPAHKHDVKKGLRLAASLLFYSGRFEHSKLAGHVDAKALLSGATRPS